MQLQESGEMYLETIHVLSLKRGMVCAVDVGEYMGYSKPSVSRAINLLKDGGYVTVDSDGHISLTKSGKLVAEKIYERHVILTNFLVYLGVEEKIAVHDACKIEHDISDETFTAIKRLAKEKLNMNV